MLGVGQFGLGDEVVAPIVEAVTRLAGVAPLSATHSAIARQAENAARAMGTRPKRGIKPAIEIAGTRVPGLGFGSLRLRITDTA